MKFQLKPIAIAVGIAYCLASSNAMATAITIANSVQATVNASSGGNSGNDNQGPASSVNANVSASGFGGGLNSTSYASGVADISGYSNLAAAARGNVAGATSQVSQFATITNTSNTAQQFNFSFVFNAGYLSIPTFGAGDEASYAADIKVNGISLWNTSFSITSTSNGSSVIAETGASIGGCYVQQHCSNFFSGNDTSNQFPGSNGRYGFEEWIWSDFSSSVNLGTFNPGQSFNFEYSLTAKSNIVGNYTCDSFGYGCAYAKIGDPNSISLSPINNKTITTTPATNQVPEPASGALIGAGLAALAYRRRKTKQA